MAAKPHSAWDCPYGTGPDRWLCQDRVCPKCRIPHGEHHFTCPFHAANVVVSVVIYDVTDADLDTSDLREAQ